MYTPSWEKIYAAQAPKLLGVCRRYVPDLQQAEDLMHDAFLAAISKQQSFAGTGPIEAWLRQITVNTVLQHLRREKKLSLKFIEDIPDAIASTEHQEPADIKNMILAAHFSQEDLLQAIDQLQEHHRVVFNLYVFEGFAHKEIAALLHISPGTSKSHLMRARRKIQEILLQKAQAMKEEQKRAALFPFFLREPTSYIDQLYRQKLSDPMIPPAPKPEFLRQLQQADLPAPTLPKPFGVKPLALGGATLVSLTSIMALLYFSNRSPKMPQQAVERVPLISKTAVPPSPEKAVALPPDDTVGRQASPVQKPSTRPSEATLPTKIVVRKNVVVKDTVYQMTEPHE